MIRTGQKVTRREALWAAGSAVVARRGLHTGASAPDQLQRSVRIAIIGLEGHYSEVLDAATQMHGVEIAAVADEDPALRREAAGDTLIAKATSYDDYHKMLDREKLDVVAVCGPNHTRAAIICECAGRKLPVIAEKPLAITLEDLESVRKTVLANKVPLTMLLPMRFYPQYRAMREIVQRGDLGEIALIAAQKSYQAGERPAWMKRRESYGGTIPYIGIHMVDLMRWISGRELVETAAFQSHIGFPQLGEIENNTAIIYRLDNRGSASLRMDYLRPQAAPTHGDDRLRIAGTLGVAEYMEGGSLTLLTASRKPETIAQLPERKFLVVDFLHSIYHGTRHVIQPDEVYRVTEIVLKTREAAESRRIVTL